MANTIVKLKFLCKKYNPALLIHFNYVFLLILKADIIWYIHAIYLLWHPLHLITELFLRSYMTFTYIIRLFLVFITATL